jgi:hypothetical protein
MFAEIRVQAFVLWLVARWLPDVSLVGYAAPIAVSVAMLVAMFVVWPLFMPGRSWNRSGR